MAEVMIHKTRGTVVESLHRGDAVAVQPDGTLLAVCGDQAKYTYLRSSAKPIQALNVLLSGAADKYGFTAAEISVICSSHFSEDYHIAAVRSILQKIGLTESALQCGAARSYNEALAYAQAEQGILPQRILSDCSGKHSGMLATCLIKGYPLDTYLQPEHPVQREIIAILAEVCDYPADKIALGIDGCSVPVFAMPIYNMALGFARFANPEYLPSIYQGAAGRIFGAMNLHPEMVSGMGGFCTALMRATGGRLIGKIGAQGVYCIGSRSPRLGIALKIEDGLLAMAPVAAMQALMELDLLSATEYQALRAFHIQPILNDDNIETGTIYPVFSFKAMTEDKAKSGSPSAPQPQ